MTRYPSDAAVQAQWAALKADSDARVADAYERGLRRGLAIAREHEVTIAPTPVTRVTVVAWAKAEAQMEREIEEAKR